MDLNTELTSILDEVLRLSDRASAMTTQTPLLGAIPELDSMAVVSILTMIEERFGVVIEDDEMDGAIFATFGSLADFLRAKLAA